jgi:HlyD family secretion protein
MSDVKSSPLALVRRRARVEDPTLPAILEYQWPSTAIVNAKTPILARNIIWIVASMVVSLVVLAGLIPIDRVITSRGIVVSQSRTILVQPLETAIVRSIEVREGQEVHAGQLLARLDATFASADLAALQAQVTTLEAEVARLKAEAGGTVFAYAGDDPNWTLQLAIYGHRRAEFDSKVENYKDRLDEYSAAVSRANSDSAAYRERLGYASDVEQMRKTLEVRQAGSRLDTLLASDTRAEMSRSLANAEQAATEARLTLAALAAERDAFVRGWGADVSQQLSEANSKLSDAQEQLNKAIRRRQLVELRSELDAVVQSVAKVSVGSVLQSGQQFITLVPADAPLEVEANISGQENGFVHLGDPVSIKFDTFPFAQYGMAEGNVRIVSPNSFTAQEEARNPTSAVPNAQSASEPFYRARIAIDHIALRGVPEGFHLIPGMPVSADIKVGKRTVLKYLLGMVLPVAHEGMREP